MKKLIVILVVVLIASGAFAIQKKVVLKCDADSYVSLMNPEVNYGSARDVLAQVLFHYDGTSILNKEIKIGFLHYVIPPGIVGKVRVLNSNYNFFLLDYRGSSPFPAEDAKYTLGFYPCLSGWDENTIVYTGHPNASGPAFYSFSSTKNTFGHYGWVNIAMDSAGVSKIQEYIDTGIFYGLALYVDVNSVTGVEPLLVGDYVHEMRIASRESGKLTSYIRLDVDVPTGTLINGCNVTPSSLGEVKASYR